jgi:hypothetical protein
MNAAFSSPDATLRRRLAASIFGPVVSILFYGGFAVIGLPLHRGDAASISAGEDHLRNPFRRP